MVSRFSDAEWDYTSWAGGRREIINFYYEKGFNDEDVYVGKRLALLRLFGVGPANSLRNARYEYYGVAKLFLACRERGIQLKELADNHAVFLDLLKDKATKNALTKTRGLFLLVLANHERLGFRILSHAQLEMFVSKEKRAVEQTLCIPTRIYQSLIDESIQIIDLYLQHKDTVETMHLDLCRKYREEIDAGRFSPFHTGYHTVTMSDFVYGYGLTDLILALCPVYEKVTVTAYSAAIKSVRQAGAILISLFTFMRSSEVLSIKCGGIREDYSLTLGSIYYVRGQSTKTKDQRDAIWTTSAYARRVFEALRHINLMHLQSGWHANSEYWQANLDGMLLFAQLSAPWTNSNSRHSLEHRDETLTRYYGKYWPKYFGEVMGCQVDDIEEALKLTPSADVERLVVGKQWPLSHHQFRRSGLVHAAASGMVSQPSLTYQAKHTNPQNTLYYQKNFLELAADEGKEDAVIQALLDLQDESVRKEYENELFHAFERDLAELKANDNRFFSPAGQHNKDRLLDSVRIISLDEFKKLSRKGVARRTLLGACFEQGFCEYGTAASVKGCVTKMNGEPCVKALVDAEKRKAIIDHREDIEHDLVALPVTRENELVRESWLADIEAANKAIDLIDSHMERLANDD